MVYVKIEARTWINIIKMLYYIIFRKRFMFNKRDTNNVDISNFIT